MPTSTVENYLKHIFMEQQRAGEGPVPMGRLAAALDVVPGTVTSMIKVLDDSGLVDYEPRSGTRLTSRGFRLALHVVRRHRLVEMFLVDALKLDWSEVHEEAEELEHAVSDKVMDKIDEFLGYPDDDPHGDPIPSAQGELATMSRQSLAECELGKVVRVARVLDQNPEFLHFVDRTGLKPPAELVVETRDPVADALTLCPKQRQPITVGSAVAKKILVEPIEDNGAREV